MTRDQARRLWELTPRTLKLLLEHSPHLFDVFVGGKALLNRAQTAVPDTSTLIKLQELLDSPQPAGLEQSGLFSEYTDLLQNLANERPLILTLDDLHWADEASLGLLFHLGRRLEGSRILVIGTYRPDELVNGRDNQPHPLTKVIDELQRSFGDSLDHARKAMGELAGACSPKQLEEEAFALYENFRPEVARGTRGWGQKGTLDLDAIPKMASQLG